MTHGLVIGKFYPPHAGHHHLIDTAAAACETVTVVVAAASSETVPLADRAAWLREAHPQPNVHFAAVLDDVPVDYDDADVWSAHVEVFRHGLRSLWGTEPVIDAVFGSEPYVEELARRFGARALLVDVAREAFPVSGTAVRADPPATWHHLSPAVRAALARRVVVVGAESSGTTTLARSLAAAYAARGGVWAATRWVPEYGRTYCEEKLGRTRLTSPDAWLDDLPWESSEFRLIMDRQLAWEDAAARTGSPLLVCDTDAFATTVWHERYLNLPLEEHPAARHDLWILTDVHGVPFEQDGWRDGETIREAMHDRFTVELKGRRHLLVTGTPAERLAQAVAAVDALLAEGWRFGAPPG
ncbi:AAA family ATPase [Actinocorallia longicatena]|uniref:Nicotinamide-nucleotide adenylyltransferase n=1 Tax=Actinocorallia longicatena TaxID=111803 RepID=A0ABP6QL23_9ACTN